MAIAQSEHDCDAVLVVIALRRDTARASRKLIRTGHPGFDLAPIVIGPDNTPTGRDGGTDAELAVLSVLTGALDLSDPEARLVTLRSIARTDLERREIYTRFIRLTASQAVRQALEELMKSRFPRDDFVDGLLDQGKTRGEAEMLLRFRARGVSP